MVGCFALNNRLQHEAIDLLGGQVCYVVLDDQDLALHDWTFRVIGPMTVSVFTSGALFKTRHAHLLSDIPAALALRAQSARVFLSARIPAMCIFAFTSQA